MPNSYASGRGRSGSYGNRGGGGGARGGYNRGIGGLRPVQSLPGPRGNNMPQISHWNNNSPAGSNAAAITSTATAARTSSSSGSAPQSTRPAPNTPPSSEAAAGKFKLELERFCAREHLGRPDFKTSVMNNKMYVCVVVVGENQRFRTYPSEFPSATMAEDMAAKIALEKLSGSQANAAADNGAAGDNGARTNGNSGGGGDVSEMAESIAGLVGSRANGVWSTRIEVEYKQKFQGSQLPPDWIERLRMTRSKIMVDEPIAGKYIIKPAPPEEEEEAIPMQVQQQVPNDVAELQQQQHGWPPEISYPDANEYWEVFVTVVNTTESVFLRLIKFQGVLDNLVTDMELHYFHEHQIPSVTAPEVLNKICPHEMMLFAITRILSGGKAVRLQV